MRSIASAEPPPAAASTDEAAAKAAYLARLEAESPFCTKKQVVAGAALASTMRSIASMASAMPLPAVTITDEAAAKAAYLARMEAESPFYTKKQGVVGAALASTMHSMASADIEGCCGSTLHLGRTCPARLRRRSAVFSHARASHSAFRGWRNAKCWGAPLSAGGPSRRAVRSSGTKHKRGSGRRSTCSPGGQSSAQSATTRAARCRCTALHCHCAP